MRTGAALALLLTACGQQPVQTSVTTATPVQTWLTTADHAKTLSHEPDLRLVPSASPGTLPTIVVDDHTTYQHMIGFGASMTDASAYVIDHQMTAAQRAALMQDLFGRNPGIGLSFVRVPLGASDFSQSAYSYDDMPAGQTDPTLAHFSIAADRADKLPLLLQARTLNLELFLMANPWSPPGWMKTTGSMIGGTLKPEAYDAFAEYLARAVEAYRAEGVPINAISVQNEPHYEPPDYPGMLLEAPARARVIGDHVGPRFARLADTTQIWDWDHNWDLPESPLGVLGDAAAHQYVQGVAWHCYKGQVPAQSQVHDAYPDKDTYFTECSGGDWAQDYAANLRYFVGGLIIGTTRNWARAVAFWNLALDAHDGPHHGGCTDCRGVVTIDSTGAVTRNVEYVALAHASQFVRPGAVRIASTSGVDSLDTVAFQNLGDHSTAVIVINEAHATRTFAVQSAGRGFQYTLPAAAVATFTWK
jgi:glucosylceramidase